MGAFPAPEPVPMLLDIYDQVVRQVNLEEVDHWLIGTSGSLARAAAVL